MAADDMDGRNAAAAFRWRWIDAARYVVALVVTALIVTVIAHSIRVLLRPDDLVILVDKGFVAVDRPTPASSKLRFSLDLEVANPSGRVVIYYEDILAYLYGRTNNMSKPGYFMTIPVKDISLKQDSTEFVYLNSYPNLISPDYKPYFNLFSNTGNKGIPDGIVAVNGTLTVGLYSWSNQTSKAATYYCWPVAIGGDFSEDTASGTQCTDNPPTPEATLTNDS